MYKDTQINCANFCSEITDIRELYDLKKGFLEILTHDLKTPIIAQIRVLQMMLDGGFGNLNTEQAEMLQLTLDSCNYMYAMVATLISTYKVDIEDPGLHYSEFNIMQVIEDTIKKVDSFLKENNIKIVILPEIKTPVIAGDMIRLTRVIHTMLLNSLNMAFKNSILKIHLEQTDNTVKVKFESRSGYIMPEKMEKIFKFHTYRTQKYDKIGTGIGLYFARKIIEKHHGKIIAESSINQKNIFGFEIPTEAPDEIYYKDCV